MTGTTVDDVVNVLLRQHQQLRRLCTDLPEASGAEKQRLLVALAWLLHTHERGERAIVHPAARDNTGDRGGNTEPKARMAEEDRIMRSIAELNHLGVDDPAFDAKFGVFRQATLDHMAHEERDEFPLIRRYLSTERLHAMAYDLHDIQAMG